MKVQADGYFTIIPEWVLYADISASAVRVFGVLNRFANSNTGKCHPSRKSLAEKAKMSLATVDRAIGELVGIGAVVVRHRTSDSGDPTSNEYTLILNRGTLNMMVPPINFEGTGLLKSDNQTIISKNESQEPYSSSSVDDGFDLFWSHYPRKVGKGAALKAWKKARKTASTKQIIAACNLYAALRRTEDSQYTAHPATWLNQERWLDETMNLEQPEQEIIIPTWTPCEKCNNGWLYEFDDKGYEYARPCECRP